MIREKRFELIQSELAKKGIVDVDELTIVLDASRATVRRDLDALNKIGVLKRTHGGARSIDSEEELPFHTKVMANIQEKRAIGITTAECIPEGSVVGCTGGTTVMSIVKHLKEKQITVVTNAINIAMELASSKSVEIVVSGGTLRSRSYEMVGHIADRTLSELNLSIALIGVDGIDMERGISTYTMQEAHAAALFIHQAKEVWVAADHSKMGKVAPAVISPLSKVTKLFTDSGIDSSMRRKIEATGIEVIIADL
ncbi:DeoR/GlpR transcriptional regulator [Sphaerochaeta halotolerans]|uniref:DeoR/GlpR transcriptional regulator n=1 Tax=Sphaerochaeta halotolerans TaxID=2293840 RepID=A0A372MKY9_9SPIR|nr:DeoR/GlpR family DNA-binding transcription regulator [Sphaerochaeta halotolerans]RFU96093.1 DeoR/GlpR transcriptional regulator [Sphaerochaeta halotolerans]